MDRYIDDEDRRVIQDVIEVFEEGFFGKMTVIDAYALIDNARQHLRRKYYESPLGSK